MKVPKKLLALAVSLTIFTSFTVCMFTFTRTFPYSEYISLGVSVLPSGSSFKLGMNESKTFLAQASNGTQPFNYVWNISPSGNFTLQVNGVNREAQADSYFSVAGQSLTLCYPYATEEFVSVDVVATDSLGLHGSLLMPFMVADPYTSPGLKFDSPGNLASYLVESDGLSWYRMVKGTDLSVAYSSTNVTKVEQFALGNTTAGAVVMKETPHNGSLTVSDNVQVVESLNGKVKRFINVLDSAGSPYTISTDGTNYLAQDSADSYIDGWTSANETAVEEQAIDALTTGGEIFYKDVTVSYTETLPTNVVLRENYHGTTRTFRTAGDGVTYKRGEQSTIIDRQCIPRYLPWGDINYAYAVLNNSWVVCTIVDSLNEIANNGIYFEEPVWYGTYEWKGKYANIQSNMFLGWGLKDYTTQSDVIEVYLNGATNQTYLYTVEAGAAESTEITSVDFTSDVTIRVIWNSSAVDLYCNGVLKVTHTGSVPQVPLIAYMNVRTTAASAASTMLFGKDWVKIA